MNPRWDQERTELGYHWDVHNMQGKYNIWFVGGNGAWDNTMYVTEYNLHVLRHAEPADESC